jgi:hypothetical protein
MRVALFGLVGLCLGCNQVLGIEAATLDAKVGSDAPKGCVLNSDCASTEICIFRVCSPPCDRDRDCMGGLECLRTTKGTACVAPKDSACGAGAKLDCPASTGTTCIDNECRTPCDDGGADACLLGQACVNGGCRRNDASPDAGEQPDGGGATIHEQSVLAPDAAGVADAGGGPMDAGGALADAGMPAPSCTATTAIGTTARRAHTSASKAPVPAAAYRATTSAPIPCSNAATTKVRGKTR